MLPSSEPFANYEWKGLFIITFALQQVVAVRDNLRRKGIEVDNEYIRETWKPVYLK